MAKQTKYGHSWIEDHLREKAAEAGGVSVSDAAKNIQDGMANA